MRDTFGSRPMSQPFLVSNEVARGFRGLLALLVVPLLLQACSESAKTTAPDRSAEFRRRLRDIIEIKDLPERGRAAENFLAAIEPETKHGRAERRLWV